MTGAEASLSVPELPALGRALGSPRFLLERTPSPDDDGAFTLTGHRARIEGGYGRGVDRVVADGARLVSRVRLSDAVTRGAALSPVGLERRLRMAQGEVVERVVVPRSDPMCFFEWLTEARLSLAITWSLPDSRSRWRRLERGLVLQAGEVRTFCALSRPPDEMTVTSDLRVVARFDLPSGEAVRLVVARAAPGDGEDRLLRIMGRPHVVVPALRAESTRRIEAGLALEAPEEAPGQALEWAKVDLAAVAPEPDTAISDRRFRLALASLASGDRGSARALVASIGDRMGGTAVGGDGAVEDEAAGAGAAGAGAAAPRLLLLVARYLAWTGDLQTVKGAWEGVRSVVALHRHRARMAPALRELRVAAEEVGDRELAGRLASALPEGTPERSPREDPALVQRVHVTDRGGGSDGALGAAALVESVVYGLMGAEPDAPRGRLLLRPRPPGSWPSFAVRRITVGAAVIDLEYRCEGRMHAFTLRQVGGGAPFRVILEPELEGGTVVAARIDGQVAELDTVPVGGRIRVPVQLVLDHERTMEVEIEPADH